MLEKIKETTSYLKSKTGFQPEAGIILGTGLGGLVKDMDIIHSLEYENIPNFAVSTVEGHKGRLIFGNLSGKKIVAMQGRFHYYEGYNMQEVTFPVRVMKYLGIKYLLVSNASGGVNPEYEIGDLMVLNDHINLLPSPLIGQNHEEFGPRFPDMSEPYDHEMITSAMTIARKNNIRAHQGCYVGVTGPALETPKEYAYFRIIGGDTVGMSTIPEIIVGRQMGLRCFGVSIITDLGVPGRIVKVTIEDVKMAAEMAEPDMTLIIKEILASL
jgi:purine-nucleoside phosphorylase